MSRRPVKKTAAPVPAHQAQEVLNRGRSLTSQASVASRLQHLAGEAARLVQADRATLFFLDEDRCELWSQVAQGSGKIVFDARLGVAGACAMSGKLINVRNVHSDSRFYLGIDTRSGYTTQTLLAVPIHLVKGDLIGVFEFLNKRVGVFTDEDEKVALAVAAEAGLAVNSREALHELRGQHDLRQKEHTPPGFLEESLFSTQRLVGTSPSMQRIVRLIDEIQGSCIEVLITGASGTGKELVAKAIHYNSPRARGPFVALNCAALPENLVESELFGIEKGVATGVDQRMGRFEQAKGGTLFLDEVADLSLTAQAKILRVLQERVLERVGGRTTIPVDVRLLAATNKDLPEAIERREFREDLYYRLNVVQIHTPALRDIPEDLPRLANHFLSKYCGEMHKEVKRWSPEAWHCLVSYAWPGNVRQLENEIKRLVATVRGPVITEKNLEDVFRISTPPTKPPGPDRPATLSAALAELETQMIRQALEACHHNQVQAAKTLGLSRQGLIKKMKRHGITRA